MGICRRAHALPSRLGIHPEELARFRSTRRRRYGHVDSDLGEDGILKQISATNTVPQQPGRAHNCPGVLTLDCETCEAAVFGHPKVASKLTDFGNYKDPKQGRLVPVVMLRLMNVLAH